MERCRNSSKRHSKIFGFLPHLNLYIKIGDVLIEIDPKYFRPTEVDFLRADITKAKKKLGWTPKIIFEELVKIMVDSDMELMGVSSTGEGKKILKEKGIHWTENRLTAG